MQGKGRMHACMHGTSKSLEDGPGGASYVREESPLSASLLLGCVLALCWACCSLGRPQRPAYHSHDCMMHEIPQRRKKAFGNNRLMWSSLTYESVPQWQRCRPYWNLRPVQQVLPVCMRPMRTLSAIRLRLHATHLVGCPSGSRRGCVMRSLVGLPSLLLLTALGLCQLLCRLQGAQVTAPCRSPVWLLQSLAQAALLPWCAHIPLRRHASQPHCWRAGSSAQHLASRSVPQALQPRMQLRVHAGAAAAAGEADTPEAASVHHAQRHGPSAIRVIVLAAAADGRCAALQIGSLLLTVLTDGG